ncbi:helix-turn-helix transcriptional regulator [Paenibacillus mendelii]|uniref:AraC family transcriptional regulator n=1 Tax=Paenibacillus mendelii TaxID=206163 RepID=A0ABV6JKT9_9BACL|nr:AraC family transcriptional regulator [Paenibacillus mendelii]MCQ6560639.1 AraC family transcriptional regulator [Paenibacillus mendelii]
MKWGKLPNRLLNENESLMHPACYIVNRTYPLHWHEFYELEFIVEGEGEHLLNGQSYPLAKGYLFLVTPSDFHEIIPAKDKALKLYNVKFSEEMLSDSLRNLLFVNRECFMACFEDAGFDRMNAEFVRLIEESANREIGSELLMRGGLERILIDLLRAVADGRQERTSSKTDSLIQEALIYIHHHYREPLTLEKVSAQSGLSPNYFSECFHKATGSSFRSYMQSLRLRAAMSLVSSSEISVTEICYNCGFNSYTHFIRAFKKKYGMAPNAFRKSMVGRN